MNEYKIGDEVLFPSNWPNKSLSGRGGYIEKIAKNLAFINFHDNSNDEKMWIPVPLIKLPTKQKLTEDGEFTSLDSVPGMGAPILASPGITGSGDIASVTTTKRKKIKKFKEFNKDKK